MTTLARERRVAFSTRAQSVRFRVVKWIIVIGLGYLLWPTSYFWWVVVTAIVLSVSGHLFWRWKTKGWTQAWGGWNDLDAGRDKTE
jgi:hypothetical protein